MKNTLKCTFTSADIELAAAIGQQAMELKEKIHTLFKKLPDPLLSADEVRELLAERDRDSVVKVLGALVDELIIEESKTTTRPLDPAGIALYRLGGQPVARLKLTGIESRLDNGKSLIQFTCDGRLIRSIARVDRLDALSGTGNQRNEIRSHVEAIAKGIESGTQVPNAILLVILGDYVSGPEEEDAPAAYVRLKPLGDFIRVQSPVDDSLLVQEYRPVQLDFPMRRAAFDEEKSALLVDGQQRTAALALVDIDKVPSFSLSVNAEIASAEEAKQVFMVANSTAKIETQFSRALLAEMGDAPSYLSSERPIVLAAKELALTDPESPFHGLVAYPNAKFAKRPPIAYNSMYQVLSVFNDSIVLPKNEGDRERMLAFVVKSAFLLVKKYWGSAWGVKPTESRLMHGVGLRAMAGVIEAKLETLYARHDGKLDSEALWVEMDASLKRLQPHIVWRLIDTQGALKGTEKLYTEEITARQNTSQDIAALTKTLRRLSLEMDTNAEKAMAKKKPAAV